MGRILDMVLSLGADSRLKGAANVANRIDNNDPELTAEEIEDVRRLIAGLSKSTRAAMEASTDRRQAAWREAVAKLLPVYDQINQELAGALQRMDANPNLAAIVNLKKKLAANNAALDGASQVGRRMVQNRSDMIQAEIDMLEGKITQQEFQFILANEEADQSILGTIAGNPRIDVQEALLNEKENATYQATDIGMKNQQSDFITSSEINDDIQVSVVRNEFDDSLDESVGGKNSLERTLPFQSPNNPDVEKNPNQNNLGGLALLLLLAGGL